LGEEKALDLIKSFNKKQIIIFGIETHICVLQTAIELVEKGFDVYLIKNASKSRQSFEHESGIDVMKNEKVNILTLEIALFELLRTSKNPNFKAVQALIK
jgi:nicotinamidase-related amidase